MKNQNYWNYNLPLQVWPTYTDPNNEKSPVKGARIVNYMPRKEAIIDIELDGVLEEQTREEFFESAALIFENMARLMREAAKDDTFVIYYPDYGMIDDGR
jgi:hypothetical protein